MIYHRTASGAHRLPVRILAGVTMIALVALGFLGSPPPVHAQIVWQDPVSLPPLNGNGGSGQAVPTPLNVELDGAFPVSISTRPTLVWRNVPAGTAQVAFKVVTLDSSNPKALWASTVAVGSDGTARVRMSPGILRQGRTYAWTATSVEAPARSAGPFSLTVDQQRSSVQPTWSLGGVSVAAVTGELIYRWQGPTLNALSGPVGWTLTQRATTIEQPGMPNGWSLAVSGTTGWSTLKLNADASVTLINTGGGAVTYTKVGKDQWRPAIGRYASAGQATLLTQNADGTFTATDGNRTATVFSRPTVNADGHPVKVWNLDAPTIQQSWVNGRLTALIDPVTDNATSFIYGGDNACGTKTDTGFKIAPDGLLCGVLDWSGNVTLLQYVDTPTGPQIGRIVSALGTGVTARVSDIGWDRSGRIVETRQPFATRVIASGAIKGLGANDTRVLTQVAYDGQGRVASVTAPQGLTQSGAVTTRGSAQISYAPFTVTATGSGATSGVVQQTWTDPLTMARTKERDAKGNVISFEYNADGSLLRTTDQSTGTVTENRYDAQGRPTEQIGPTRSGITSPTAPHTQTAYDEDVNGRPWTGLAVRYWSNAGFNGSPAGGTTGPILPGTTGPVSTLSMNWAESPVGSGPWAARLTGLYTATADGRHTFRNTTQAQLWVNSTLCSPSCNVKLAKGAAAAVHIDVASPTGAAAGVNALVTTPDGVTAPIPTSALAPNYGLATSTTVREHKTGVGVTDLVSRAVYDPVTTQLLKTIAPSGATQTRTYEPYDPAKGQWGRSTSVTDASGKTTTSSFYAANAAAGDCAGVPYAQEGRAQSTTLVGGRTVTHVTAPGGGPLKVSDGTTTTCGSSSGVGVTTSTTTGVGPEVSSTSVQFVNGNPLVLSMTVTSQGSSERTTEHLDTNGTTWRSIDAFGTVTETTTDPYSGNILRLNEKTAGGEQRTIDYTYASTNQLATVTVNGTLLLTHEYGADGGFLRTRLANGAVQTVELDENNFGRKIETTFANGAVTSETAVRSPSGRILARTLSGPSGSSTYRYRYNVDGRLVDTKLAGSIPANATAWTSTYTGAEGHGGNRSGETVTRPDGKIEQGTFAYGTDNRLLTASAGRIAGDIRYDAAGRATRIGGIDLAYDAAGNLLSARQGDRAYTFTDNGLTTTFSRTLDDGTTSTMSVSSSGKTLLLGADRRISAQVISLANNIKVVLDQNGGIARWIYDDMLGNMTWRSTGNGGPGRTHLYSPDGEPISAVRGVNPTTPVDLIVNSMGWKQGMGASTLRLAAPLMIVGSRIYTPDGARWLQPDPDQTASLNAYEYAIGDPINFSDPSGNSAWGWLWGGIAAIVVGAAIGTLTFGIGPALTASYGIGAIFTQVAVGAVGGAIAGAVGEIVTQTVNSGGVTDWSSVGIAAGIGAALGGISSGAGSLATKYYPYKGDIRAIASSIEFNEAGAPFLQEGKFGISEFQETVKSSLQKAARERGEGIPEVSFSNDMFTTKGKWNPKYRAKVIGENAIRRSQLSNALNLPADAEGGAMMAANGDLVSSQVHVVQDAASMSRKADEALDQVFQESQLPRASKQYVGDYDLNQEVLSSISSTDAENLARNAELSGNAFQYFILQQVGMLGK